MNTNVSPELFAAEQQRIKQTRQKHSPRIIFLLVAVTSLAWLGRTWWFETHYVQTDNAQVDGDIIPVSAKIAGFVASVGIKENQQVKAGNILVTLDDRDPRAKLTQAEAELASAMSAAGHGAAEGQAQAEVQSAQAQLEQAQANIAQAQADHDNARQELERLRPMLARKLVSTQQFDAADARERSAAARLQAATAASTAAQQQVSVYRAALRGADAKLQAAMAARDLAANMLADTRVLAAAGGMVSQKVVEPGQFVQAGEPMMELVLLDDVWVVANLKETDIGGVRIGSPAEFTVDAYPGTKWTGTVESLSPATGSRFTLLPPDNATGNFTKVVQRMSVRILVGPGQHTSMPLRPGMSSVVTIART